MRPNSDDTKKAQGTFTPARSRQPLGVPKGRPTAPAYLSAEAKAEWDYVIADLEKSGCLAKVDRTMLAMYAALTAEFASNPVDFTAAKITQLRLICGELGFSISARLKLRQPEGAGETPDPCKPKNPSGKVVSISRLLSGTPKGSSPEPWPPADMSDLPASDS